MAVRRPCRINKINGAYRGEAWNGLEMRPLGSFADQAEGRLSLGAKDTQTLTDLVDRQRRLLPRKPSPPRPSATNSVSFDVASCGGLFSRSRGLTFIEISKLVDSLVTTTVAIAGRGRIVREQEGRAELSPCSCGSVNN